MVCFRPIDAYRAHGGTVAFSSREGFGDRHFCIPCGQCLGCRIARRDSWALRSVHESRMHLKSCFVTLTYDQEHLPKDGSVDVREWQLFAKRVRHELGPFRFLHCGEYGGDNYRPHYHALMFGHDFSSDRVLWDNRRGYPLWASADLMELWGNGQCLIGNLNFSSASYVAKYCVDKLTGDSGLARRRRIDLETGEEYYVKPEYITMSRNPGLGAGWFDRYKSDLFPSDECVHDGTRHAVPQYYLRRLEAEDPLLYARVRRDRRASMFERCEELPPDGGLLMTPRASGDLTRERLAVREQVALAERAFHA